MILLAAQGQPNDQITANFNGRDSFIEIPPSTSLQLGQGDLTLSARVWTAPDTEDVLGDILTHFDPVRRRGFNFGLKARTGGYSSHGDDRHVFFGIDGSCTSSHLDAPADFQSRIARRLLVLELKERGDLRRVE